MSTRERIKRLIWVALGCGAFLLIFAFPKLLIVPMVMFLAFCIYVFVFDMFSDDDGGFF